MNLCLNLKERSEMLLFAKTNPFIQYHFEGKGYTENYRESKKLIDLNETYRI